MVYPDCVLAWLGQVRGRRLGKWPHILLLEAVALIVTIVAMLLLMLIFPRIVWWEPFFYVGVASIVRFIYWFIAEMINKFFDL